MARFSSVKIQAGRWLIWNLLPETRHEVLGFEVRVANSFAPRAGPEYAEELQRALALLQDRAPRWFERGRVSVRGIAIWDAPVLGYAGTFNRRDRLCSFHPHWVLSDDTNTRFLATLLVHEFVHAWVYSQGLDCPRHQRRIEQLCRVAQFACAKRIGADPQTLRTVSAYLSGVGESFDEATRIMDWIRDIEAWDVPRWYRLLFLGRKAAKARARLAALPQVEAVHTPAEIETMRPNKALLLQRKLRRIFSKTAR